MRAQTCLVTLALSLVAAPAGADVLGGSIPKPVVGCYSGQPNGLAAIFACVCTTPGTCNIGKACPGGSTSCDPGQNGTCEATIWHNVNDDPCIPSNRSGLDPIKDAWLKPETFKPVCGLKFTMVSRGGAMFKNAFGWYNVVAGKAPDASDLHVLLDSSAANGKVATLDVSDPAYKGGDVGFFIATPESHTQKGSCANGDCAATVARAQSGEGYIYYSQASFNPDTAGTIHLLIYASKLEQFKYYFAWEDLFNTVSTDFSDFVTSVSGVACSGGGGSCTTGKPGVCSFGLQKCGDNGQLTCEGANTAGTEICDGLDNDCDGKVDNGAVCPEGKQCFQGVCVGSCSGGQEFACAAGYQCDSTLGLCVDSKCTNKVCTGDEICRQGSCGNGCDGVVCPQGQTCQGGLCVDPCAGKSCKPGELCKLGVCLPGCQGCGGITCTSGLTCNQQSGDCYDASCKPDCAPGTTCKKGQCVGPCDGVVCPGSVACVDGKCPPPALGKGKPGDGTLPGLEAMSLRDSGASSGDHGPGFTGKDGCSCRVGSAPTPSAPLALLLGACALLLVAIRRRSR
jgi:MYXO-CTERM domain-containing protein